MYLDAVRGLGETRVCMEHPERGLPLLKEAVDGYKSLSGTDDEGYLRSVNSLGLYYLTIAEYASAEKAFQEIVDSCARLELGDSVGVHRGALQNLGAVYLAQMRYADAEPLIHRSLKACEATLTANHSNTAQAMSAYAAVLRGLGRTAEAIELDRRANAILEASGSTPARPTPP